MNESANRAPSLLDRRRLVAALAGAGVAGLYGTTGQRGAAASGQVAGASLVELARLSDWRRSWDLIVPLGVDRAFPRAFLLYDRAAGEATLASIDSDGRFREIRQFSSWRTSWDALTPSGFPRAIGLAGLIAYDRAAGVLNTLQINLAGGFEELRLYSNWRKSWTAFVPIGTAGFLAYDRGAGFATLSSVDGAGALREVRSHNDWRRSWDIITAGPFTSGAVPPGDILLYDRAAREAAGLTIEGTGLAVPFATYSGWRSSWSAIQGGLFLVQGATSSGIANLMLFDREALELEFLDIGPDSLLTSLLLTRTPGTQPWTSATAIGPDLLLLYDRAAGMAGFYVTNRTPLSPTPSPTPTPRPTQTPTPTPASPRSGSVTVRLQQGRGNDWHTYTARSDSPRTGPGQNAYITGVKNTADKRIALIHRERSGKRTGPVFVKAGEVSDRFNGMLVAGDWEARVTSSQSEAPARIPLDIRYEVR